MKKNFFNFRKIDDTCLITNDAGKFCFLSDKDFRKFINDTLESDSAGARELIEKGFLYDDSDIDFSEKNAGCILCNKGYVASATSLHIFVVTTECNMNCVYCQANSKPDGSDIFMSRDIARKAVDIALQSPEYELSFEFQGGEPLLNFPVIRFIVEYSEQNRGNHYISYSLVSNLTLLTEDMADFIKEHNISVSTSIDGYMELHNTNRHYPDGRGSFEGMQKALELLRQKGVMPGAIETTTRSSLNTPERIVDTYKEMAFSGIFIRSLSPLGRAGDDWDKIGYSSEEYLDFYIRAFNRIIEINKDGTFFQEYYAATLLKKIFGIYVNYMELRSPCGGGLGQLAYYADGNIYTCDEGRMMSEMGVNDFLLGNVENTYEELIRSSVCRTVCASGILESIPGCCDCVYQPYCGVCPVVNYALYDDVIAKTPNDYKCRINKGILDMLFDNLRDENSETTRILKSWVD